MPGALLRSGKLKDYKALGEDGQPIYTSAMQLREAIRLKLGRDAAQCLAVPQRNECGDVIDWYAPEPGDVVPWSSATDDERTDAKRQLESMHGKLIEASASISASTSREQQIFTRLLKKVIHFPDDSHVYLVNGKPVLTFWGFIDPQANSDDNPIGRLRMRAPAAAVLAEPAAPPPPEVAVVEKKRFPWWWLLLFLLLLLLLLLWLLRSCAPEVALPGLTPEIVAPTEQLDRDGINRPVDWVNGRGVAGDGVNGLPAGADGLAPGEMPPEGQDELPPETPDAESEPSVEPEQPMEPEQPQDEQQEPPVEPEPVDEQPPMEQPETPQDTPTEKQAPVQPPPNTPLGIPPDAASSGSTDFLDGGWKAAGGIQDSQTGRPMKMEYDFKDGKGKVKVSNGAGRECVGDVSANMGGGGLTIENQGQAKCNDGTTYSLPAVKCQPGATSAADCTGSYADDEFPISIKKN